MNTTTSGVLPINSCYNFNYTQQIVLASEFAQGNGANGVINKIRYYYPSSNTISTTNWNSWTVYLGTTTQNTFASTSNWIPLTALTQVYSGTVTPIGGNWMEITLTTPFPYNAASNLVVAVREQVSGFNCTANWASYTASGNQGIYYYSDSTNPNPASPVAASGISSSVAQIRFDITPDPTACFNYSVSNISHNSVSPYEANLSFAGGMPTGIEYVLTTTNTAPTGATIPIAAGTTSLNLPNLLSNTDYYFWYRKTCTDNSQSVWLPYIFRTPCGIMVDNFYEGFETTPTGSSSNITTPVCWSYVNTVGTSNAYGYVSTTASYAATGSRGYYTYRSSTASANGNLLLISPETNNLGSGTKRIRFKARKSSESYVPKLEIFTMNGTTATATKTLVHEVPVTFTYSEYIVYLPNTTDDYFAFSFDRVGTASYVYIDDVYYEDAPSCIPVTSVSISNVEKFTASVSWQPTLTTATATYSWELRTSGLPGSGAEGLAQSGTTAAGVTTLNLTNLLANTTYFFYVKANCLPNDSSTWDELNTEFTTICDYPDLLTFVAPQICGIGTSNVVATSTGGIIQWFANVQGAPLHVGNTFETPVIDQTTTFYVRTGQNAPNTTVQVGTGTSTSSSSGYSPYASGWGGYKTQYIYTVSELIAAGLSAGPINRVGFDITSTSNNNRADFTIHMGTTTQSVATNTHVGNLELVYSNASQALVAGINDHIFDTPFIWDGISNIVVQVNWSNNNSSQTGGSVRYHTVPAVQTTYTYADNRTAAQFLETITGSVAGSGSTTTNSYRANTYFNGVGLCASPFTPVSVVVVPSPEFALSTDELTVCQGNVSEVVAILTGGDDFDTYTFSPTTGVSGNAQTGWIFNPQQTTTYSVVASQTNGVCAKEFLLTVNVTSLAYEELDESYVTCANEALELSIMANDVDINQLPALTLGNLSFEDSSNFGATLTGNGTSIAQNTTNSTVGTSSLKWTYQNNALGELTINQSFNGSNSYGMILEFDHIAILENNSWDWGHVQYSLDGGNTWVNFQQSQYLGQGIGMAAGATGLKFSRTTYSSWVSISAPNSTLWKTEKLYLSSNVGNLSDVKFRFTLRSDSSGLYDGWYIDNIVVKKVDLPEILWSPSTNLFVDEALTQPYNGESLGTVYFNQNQSGNFPYSVSISNSMINCAATIETEVVIPELIFQGLNTSYYCTATAVEDLDFDTQNGVTYLWFNSLQSQAPLTTISNTGTYYVQIVTDQCSSNRQPVHITIVGNVNVTVASTQTFCDAATVADLIAIPSNALGTVQWFSSSESSTPLDLNTELVNGSTYYVNQVLYGCTSVKLPVTVQILSTPNPLISSDITVCSNTVMSNVVIDNQSLLRWYASPISTTPLSGQSVLTSGTYYVTVYNGVCDSERRPINVTVVQSLSTPQVTLIDICGTGVVSDLNGFVNGTNSSASLRWFVSANATTPLESTQPLVTGTYYVEQYLTGCSSARKAVAVRVTSKVAPVINAQQVCQGTLISEISIPSVSGVTYNWYLSPSSTTMLPANTVLTTGTYYVRRVQYNCISEPTQVSVNVLQIPTSPTGELTQVLAQGSMISDIDMDQPGIIWYITYQDAITGNNPLQQNLPLVDGQIYYGVLMNAQGCASLPTAVEIEIFLGINDLDISNLKVYPNPTKDLVYISYKENIDRVEVFSMIGQRVLDVNSNDSEVSIDMSNFASGTYMLKISVGNDNQLVKVIKK